MNNDNVVQEKAFSDLRKKSTDVESKVPDGGARPTSYHKKITKLGKNSELLFQNAR